MKECESKCFLKPDTESFSICPKCELGDGACLCQIDCAGAQAAYNRAKQYGYPDVATKAKRILDTKCKNKLY